MTPVIRIYPHNAPAANLQGNGIAALTDVTDVRISRDLQGGYELTFNAPNLSKVKNLQEENICKIENQLFRIKKISDTQVTAQGIYTDAAYKHIQYLPDMIGAKPRDVMVEIFAGTPVQVLTESEVRVLGMEWVTDLTDFFAVSKITPLGALDKLTATLEKYKIHAELYINNYKIALVKQIGTDRGARIDLRYNATEIKTDRDTTEMITRLYPYGMDDLHIGSVNGGKQYIDSPHYSEYPREGYMEFSEIDDPEELLKVAKAQFAADNPDRIDVPKYSISASYSQRKPDEIRLGDVVTVNDIKYKFMTKQRVISVELYPFEPHRNAVTLGHTARSATELFDGLVSSNADYEGTLNAKGEIKPQWLENLKEGYRTAINTSLANNVKEKRNTVIHDYGDIWVNPDNRDQALAIVGGVLAMANGRYSQTDPEVIAGNATAGDYKWSAFGDWTGFTADVINAGILNTALVNVIGSNGRFKISDNLLTIDDKYGRSRLQAGLVNGEYVFRLLDVDGNTAAEIDGNGDLVCYNAKIKGQLDTTSEGQYGYRIYDNTIVGIDRTGSEEKRSGLRSQIDEFGAHLELFVDDQPGLNVIVDKSGTNGKLCAKYCVDNPNNTTGGENATWIVFESEGTSENSKTKMYGSWNVANSTFTYDTPSMYKTAIHQKRVQIGNEYFWIRNGLLFPGN